MAVEKKLNLGVAVDASGAKDGLQEIKDAAKGMAQSVAQSGQQAGKGVDNIGAGAGASAQKVDTATRSLIGSIQRTTAAMESGAKGSGKYYEALASQRGVSVDALKPYILQLEAVTEKTRLAAEGQKTLAESMRFLDGLKSQAESIGKTASQLAEMKAAQLGVSDAAGPMIAKMRAAEQGATGMGAALSKASGYIKLAVASMAGFSVAGLVKDSAMLAARFETMGVVMGVAGNNAGYTRAQMADLEKQMQKTGISMIASREVLTSLATANIDLANATKLARSAQDLAVVGNINSSEALERMTNGIKSGQVEVLRTLGLNISFEDSYKRLAQSLGVSTESLTEQQKVMARSNAVIVEAARYNGIYEESMTTAGKAINSLTRYWEDFKVMAGDAFLPALADSVFGLTEAIKAANAELEKAGSAGTINSIGDGLAGAFKSVYQTVVVLGASVGYVLQAIGREIGGIAAQAAAVAQLDFKGAAAIGVMMKQDAEAARNAIDAFSESILNGAKVSAKAAKVSEAERIAAGEAAKTAGIKRDAEAAWGKLAEQNLSKELKLKKEIASAEAAGIAAGKSRAEIEGVIANIRAKSDGSGGAAAIKKEASAYATLIASINEKINVDRLELAAGLNATESQKIRIKLDQELAAGKLVLTAAHKQELEARLKVLDALQYEKDESKFYAEQAKARFDASSAAVKAATDESSKNELLARTFGMTKSAIEKLEIARLEEQRAQIGNINATTQETAELDALIDAKKRNAAAMNSIESQEAAKKAHEEYLADWKKTVEKYDDVFRIGFAEMLNNGKNGWQSFTKSLVTTFKTSVADQIYKMFAQPFVVKFVASMLGIVGGGVSGMAQAATGGVGGVGNMLSMGKSLWDGFSGGLSSGLGSIVSGIGGMIGSSAVSAFGAGMGMTMSGVAGAVGSSAVAAGVGVTGAAGSAMSAGAMMGAALPWIGAAIAVASLWDKAFGMGPKEVTSQGIHGNFSGSGFAGNNFADWKQEGGWLRSDRSGTDRSALDDATSQGLAQGFASVKAASSDFAKALGLDASSISNYSQNIHVALTNDAAKNQEIFAKIFTDMADSMAASAAPGLAAFSKGGETSAVTLQRLATSLTSVNGMFDTLNLKLYDASLAGGDMASHLADLVGGLDNLAAASKSYYETYYTEGERAARSQEDMTKALAKLNLAMPDGKDAFRDLAESLDLTTEAGRTAYATLLTIAPEFAATADALATLSKDAAAKLFGAFSSAAQIDFAGLSEALTKASAITFADTVWLVFENLGARIKSVIDNIASERTATGDAIAQLNNPTAMSLDAIRLGVAGINTSLPGNAGVVGAANWLQSADAQKQAATSADAAAQAAFQSASKAQTQAQSQLDAARAASVALDAAAVTIYQDSDYGGRSGTLGIGSNGIGSIGNDELSSLKVAAGYMATLFDHGNFSGSSASYTSDVAGVGGFNDRTSSIIVAKIAENSYDIAARQASSALADAQAKLPASESSAVETAAALAVANENYAKAVSNAKEAQLAYAEALQNFAIDASKSVGKLGKLREETLKYYEAQKALSDLMAKSAAGLRESVRVTRMGQLDANQSLAQRQGDFQQNYSLALATTGATQAGYADKLASALPGLSSAMMDIAGTRADWARATASLLAQSESVATQLEANKPTDYVAESLAMLQSIDATMAALEESAKSAEKIIADAVAAGSEKTAGGLRAVIAALTGQSVPAFATGGSFGGGLRIVGENGPELEATGPSRIFSTNQLGAMLSSNGSDEMVQELRALRDEVRGLRAEAQATASHTNKTARLLDRVMPDGDALATRAAA